MDPTALVVVAVGLLLCYAGVRSVHVALLAWGFAVGWLIAEACAASFRVALVVALATAAATGVLGHLVFRVAMFCVGGFAGMVIGAKVFGLLQPEDRNVVLVVLFVAATGFIGGLVTQRFRHPAIAAFCALAGAALVVSGLARTFPQALGFLRNPPEASQAVVTGLAWLTLAGAGWAVQRRPAREKARAT